jgi:heme-NO-binding protein
VHGVLLVAYRRFLADRFGAKLASEVFARHKNVASRQTYPDEAFAGLVDRGATLARREPDGLLREFGVSLISTFHEMFPSYFPPEGAKRFLLGIDKVAHARIKDLLPGSQPPKLEVTDLSGGKIKIVYQSDRKLCALLAGMLDGVGSHYQTPVRHYQASCMHKGAPQCVFMVEVQQTLLPRGRKK